MKKRIWLPSALAILMIAALGAPVLCAEQASLKVGLRYWYPIWDREEYIGFEEDPETKWGMVGPALDVELTDEWSLASAFMFGQFECVYPELADMVDKMDRYDFLLDVAYRPLADHESLFLQSFRVVGSTQFVHWDYEDIDREVHKNGFLGPGLGIAAAQSCGRFYWSAFAGYAYLFSIEDADELYCNAHMVHGSAGAGFAITPNLTLDLYYRVEWFDNHYKETEYEGLDVEEGSGQDLFHGPHATISYRF